MHIDHWEEWTPMCDGCSARGRDCKPAILVTIMDADRRNAVRMAKRLARNAGWLVTTEGKTLCPACGAKRCSSEKP